MRTRIDGSTTMIVETYQYGSLRNRLARLRQLFRGRFHRKFARDIKLLQAFLPRAGVHFDIGADHGRFALELARQCGKDCRILAFEPLAYNSRVLERLIADRKNVESFRIALSDKEDQLDFYVPLAADGTLDHGGSFVARPDDASEVASSPRVFLHEVVAVERLDHFVERHPVERLDFLKIDVEGHEQSVITGALRVLSKFRPSILMEIHGRLSFRSGFDPCGAVRALANLGYRFFDLDRRDEGRWCEQVEEVTEPLRKAQKGHDVLCWHPEGPVPGTPPPIGIEFSKTRFGT